MYQVARHVKHALCRGAFRICRAGLRAAGAVPLSTILILGHMRSGSTLLLHILLTHPEIIGCGERNAAYHSADELDRLAMAARLDQFRLFKSFRYVVDQINHDRFTPCEELLQHPQIRLIFLTREPPTAISSIVNLSRTFYDGGLVEEAADYYEQRLRTLARYSENLPRHVRALRLTYRELVEHTSHTFERLQDFLALKTGFTEQYDLQQFTGHRGDPAEKIQAGTIVRDGVGTQVELPAGTLDRAWQSYYACQQAMERFA